MNWKDGLQLSSVGINAIVALIFGFALTSIGSQAGDIGGIKTKLDTMETTIADGYSRLDKSITLVGDELQKVVRRVEEAETDPIQLLARHGLSVSKDFAATSYKNTIFLFPQTAEVEQQLLKVGYQRHNLTPVVAGFALPDAAPASFRSGDQ